MSFPTRASRLAFGPKPRNKRRVINPQTELDASIGDLIMWQLAGAGLGVPLAWALVRWDGAALQIDASAEAWNPNADALLPSVPTPLRAAQGHYRLTYPATVKDRLGADVALNFVFAGGFVQDLADLRASWAKTGANVLEAKVRDAAGALTDPTALLIAGW